MVKPFQTIDDLRHTLPEVTVVAYPYLVQRLCDLSDDLVGVRADPKVRWCIFVLPDIVSYFDCIQELITDGIYTI